MQLILPLCIALSVFSNTHAWHAKYNRLVVSNTRNIHTSSLSKLQFSPDGDNAGSGKENPAPLDDSRINSQVARLKAEAAKLRAEAALLEAEEKTAMVRKLGTVFDSFDTNRDGKISLEELRDGLSRVLEASVSEQQARKIMDQFDKSGDGALQFDEFQNVDNFRSKFERILDEERRMANEAQRNALLARDEAQKLDAISVMINNKPPTSADRIVSVLPFLLPLLDALPYASSLIRDYQLDSNPLIVFVSFLFILYQTVPFSGLIAFFLFNALSTNLRLNRLVRYNIQLAILLDILLIFPGLFSTSANFLAQLNKVSIPEAVSIICSDITFAAFASTILYAVISSLLGKEPDRIPFLTQRIKQRVPTTEEFQNYYKQFEERMKVEADRQQQEAAERRRQQTLAKKGKSSSKDEDDDNSDNVDEGKVSDDKNSPKDKK